MILCGLPCSGKTIIGSALAERLSLPFVDTDRLLEERGGACVRTLWQTHGEIAFRRREEEVILALDKCPQIVALGGGALLSEKNRAHLAHFGDKIYLKSSISVLYQRLQARGLPPFLRTFEEFEAMAERRCPQFEDFSDREIETNGLSLEQILPLLEGNFNISR